MYGMPGLNSSIAYVFTSLLGVLYFFHALSNNSFKTKRNEVPKYLSAFFVYAIFSRFITGGISIPIDLFILFLFAYLYFNNIKFSYLIKAFRIVALICISFFWIQEISFLLTGSRPTGIIPGLTVITTEVSTAQFKEILSQYARSTSFFSEPAHFAQFLLPLLCLELFGPDKSIVKASVIAVTLLYLRSGNAMLGLGVIAAVYVLQLFKGGLKLRQKFFVLLVVIAAGYGGYKFMNTEDGQELLSRENEVTDTELVGSGFVRLYRGYWLYADFNLFEKLVGVNDPNVLELHIKHLPSWVFSYGQKDYFNGIQYLLVHTGLIGTILFFLLYISLWKRNDICGRCCLLTCIALSFIAAIHLTPFMFSCLLIAKFRQQDFRKEKQLEEPIELLQTY